MLENYLNQELEQMPEWLGRWSVVDPENWTGGLALESPWWGGMQHGTDQEGSWGSVQG